MQNLLFISSCSYRLQITACGGASASA